MIKSFLSQVSIAAKAFAPLQQNIILPESIVVSLGNEAADADTIISALCYSYLRHSIDSKTNPSSVFHMPIVPVPRNEICLRQDVNILLQAIDMNINDLISIDEIPFKKINKRSKSLKYILLDHNLLSLKTMSYFSDETMDSEQFDVLEILDHHIDLKKHKNCVGNNRRIAFDESLSKPEVGSACTLVYEQFCAQAPSLLHGSVATLLMGVIALDTMNMDPSIGKGTPRDQEALTQLSRIATIDRNILFEKVRRSKMDIQFWKSLSAENACKLDYKSFSSVSKDGSTISFGMSSVLLPVELILTKVDILTAVQKYLIDDKQDLLIISSFVDGEKPYRQLLIFSLSQDKLVSVSEYLRAIDSDTSKHSNLKFGLDPITFQGDQSLAVSQLLAAGIHCVAYNKSNLQMSRKQLAPIFTEYYSK